MARKKKFGLTTPVRYTAKAYRVIASGVDPEIAKEYARALTNAYTMGFSYYHINRKKVMDSEVWSRIPARMRGLYSAYVNEVISKVMTKGTATIQEIVEKWAKDGFDEGILWDIAEVLGLERPEVEQSKPAPKA